jgi:tetratricopeptide (TPR) repeat protein
MAAGCAVVVLSAGVGCGGAEERKAEYTAKAKEYVAAGNFPKARVALRNVLKIDPKDAEAYFLFAQVEEKEKNWRSAFGNYLKAVELDPVHRGALVKLGKFYLEARLADKVGEVADKLVATYPDDPSGETLQAAALAMKGRMQEALAKAEATGARYPTDPDAAILLATLYRVKERGAEAEAVLRRAIAAHPGQVELLANLGDLLFRGGKTAEAETILKQIVVLEPAQYDHRLKLAAFYVRIKDVDKAEAILREAVTLDPGNEERRLGLAELLATYKGLPQGEAALLEARKELPHSMKIRFALGKLYESWRQPDKARGVYDEIVNEEQKRPSGLEAQVKLAALDLAAGKTQEAERRVQTVLKENPSASDALVLQGRLALAHRDSATAVQAFRSVLRDQPEEAEVKVLLSQAYRLQGESSLARETLEQVIKADGRHIEARRALLSLELAEGRRVEARRQIDEILAMLPRDVGTLAVLLDLQIEGREWREAEQTLARFREAGADAFSTDVAEGSLAQAQGQWDKARAAFERALASKPDEPSPLFGLVRIELAQKRPDRAEARLREVLAKSPRHPYAHGMLGEVLLARGDQAQAEQEFREATKVKPDWLTPWIDWSTLKQVQKKPMEAIAILREGLQANPGKQELRMMLASLLNETGQTDEAIKEYDELLRDNPRLAVAANNLASLLVDRKGDPASLERALALTRDFEKTDPNPFFLDTLGWVYLKLGQHDEAVRVIRQAAAKAPDHPLINYHLGLAYYRTGDRREAKVYLGKAVRSDRPFAGREDARNVLAEIQKS